MDEAKAPVGVLPDEPIPVRFMNTVWADRSGVHDALTSRDDLSSWLTTTGVVDAAAVTDTDVEAYRRLRDALRRLAAQVTDDARPAAASTTREVDVAVAQVNAAAATNPSPPQLQRIGRSLQRIDGSSIVTVSASRSALAAEAIELLTGEFGGLLRACPAPSCVLYFVKDHPRRAWCSTACGNRARAARHYRRHRAGPDTDA